MLLLNLGDGAVGNKINCACDILACHVRDREMKRSQTDVLKVTKILQEETSDDLSPSQHVQSD